jgi:hypothetical protein
MFLVRSSLIEFPRKLSFDDALLLGVQALACSSENREIEEQAKA